MSAKFTPGPWFAREWNTHDKTTVLVDAPDSFLKVRQIAECEEEADARLIACAPELLEVLQTIVRVADGRAIPGNLILDENSPLMDAARDAIRKATGEQQ